MAFIHGDSYNLTAAGNTDIGDYMTAIHTHVNGPSVLWQVVQATETLRAIGSITVLAGAVGTPGDVLTIGSATLTGVTGAPAANQYDATTPATINDLAAEIRRAINDPTNLINAQATARLPSTPGAVVDIDSVAPGVIGNSKNLVESTAGVRYFPSGAFLSGGAVSPGLGSNMMILEPITQAFELLILNIGTQDTPDVETCYVAINPGGAGDRWVNGEEPNLGGGAFGRSGTTPHSVGIVDRASAMRISLVDNPGTEFFWLEYPDAITWLTKGDDTVGGLVGTRARTKTGWHAGKIFDPFFVTDISAPASGQNLDGFGILGYQPYFTTATGSSGIYWMNSANNGSRYSRIRVGPDDGDNVANFSTGGSVTANGKSWVPTPRPHTTDSALSDSDFKVGRDGSIRPHPLVATVSVADIPLGTMKYLKLVTESRPLTKHQVSGVDYLMTVGISTTTDTALAVHIENGFDPRP